MINPTHRAFETILRRSYASRRLSPDPQGFINWRVDASREHDKDVRNRDLIMSTQSIDRAIRQ